jgi:hypothetical protein
VDIALLFFSADDEANRERPIRRPCRRPPPFLPVWLSKLIARLQALFVNRAMRLRDPVAPLLLTFGLSVIVRNLMVEALGVSDFHRLLLASLPAHRDSNS